MASLTRFLLAFLLVSLLVFDSDIANTAFPAIATAANSVEDSDTSSHTVSLPSGIQSGDLLLGFFASDDNGENPTWPGGWNEIIDIASANNDLSVAWREADGGEGATITVTTSTVEKSAHIVYRITGAEDPDTQAPEVSTGATGSSDAPDPDSLTPTGGAADFLWFAVAGHDNNPTVSTFPTNYTNGEDYQTSATGAAGIGVARRELNAASENPGTFALSFSEQWAACTVVVHPSAAVAVVPMRTLMGVGT